jgi:acetyl-CoA decarbonylase/synthase complex subunit alpha
MAKAPDAKVVAEAGSKCTECDACFHACPNSLQISTALKGANGKTASDLFDSCIYCGKCEDVCPEKIPVIDCIIADSQKKIAADNFKMRAGRGPLSHIEFRDLTFGLVLGGNGPGLIALLGCGHNKESTDELADIALELLDRNCAVMTAGCGAAEIAAKIHPENKKFMQENYLSMATLKGLVNCGGCSGISHIGAAIYNLASLGGGIAIHGNFDQPADYSLNRAPFVVVIWGPASDRMMAQAAGFARAGASVVIGPSGFKYNRSLISNKYDRKHWKMFDGMKGTEREIDPCPMHLIYPVETKEEAITMAIKLCIIPCALRDSRLSTIDNYTETHQKFFGSFPDDWSLFLRSPLELPVMKRIKMLSLLKKEGWVIDQKIVARAKNRDGKMVSMEEYTETYGIKQGQYATLVKRLIMR